MADVTFTAANVTLSSGPQPVDYVLGATSTQGQVVYLDNSDNKLKLSDADAAATASCIGMLANAGSNGQPTKVYTPGTVVNLGGGLTKGVSYFVSQNAGAICPLADLGAGDSIVLVGIAISTSLLYLVCYNTTATV